VQGNARVTAEEVLNLPMGVFDAIVRVVGAPRGDANPASSQARLCGLRLLLAGTGLAARCG